MFRQLLAALALAASTAMAGAADFPAKSITIIAPLAAGGGGDIAARFVAEHLSKSYGQTVVVENVTGGGGMIGTGRVAQAEPDGYTLLLQSTTLTMVPATRDDLPFDPAADLMPIAVVSNTEFVLVAGPKLAAANFQEFQTEGREREILAATAGAGGSTHFANALIASNGGMKVKSVHYKGGAEAIVDVAAGRVDVYAATMTSAKTFLESGQVRPIAVMGSKRLEAFPDVPTFREGGMDVEVGLWFAVFAPGGTPQAVADKLNADINALMASPEGVEFLKLQQASQESLSQPQFAEFVAAEYARWKTVAETQGLKQK